MLENFIYAKQKQLFTNKLDAGEVLDEAIVFIEDTKEIWTHGSYFATPIDSSSLDSEIYVLPSAVVLGGTLTSDELAELTDAIATKKVFIAQYGENGWIPCHVIMPSTDTIDIVCGYDMLDGTYKSSIKMAFSINKSTGVVTPQMSQFTTPQSGSIQLDDNDVVTINDTTHGVTLTPTFTINLADIVGESTVDSNLVANIKNAIEKGWHIIGISDNSLSWPCVYNNISGTKLNLSFAGIQTSSNGNILTTEFVGIKLVIDTETYSNEGSEYIQAPNLKQNGSTTHFLAESGDYLEVSSPTKTSELTNDSNFVTKTEVESMIANAITTALNTNV